MVWTQGMIGGVWLLKRIVEIDVRDATLKGHEQDR